MITQWCHPSPICKYHLEYGRFPVFSLLPLLKSRLRYYVAYFIIIFILPTLKCALNTWYDLKFKTEFLVISPQNLSLSQSSPYQPMTTPFLHCWVLSLGVILIFLFVHIYRFDHLSTSPLLLPCSESHHFSIKKAPNGFLLISFHLATHLPTHALLNTVSTVILLWPNSDHNSHLLKTSNLSLNTHTRTVKAKTIRWHIQGPGSLPSLLFPWPHLLLFTILHTPLKLSWLLYLFLKK